MIKEQAGTKAAVYRQGGPAALQRLMDREDEQRRNSYVLRIIGPDHRDVLLHVPPQWISHDFHRLDRPSDEFQWIELANGHDEDPYEFAVLKMPDNSLLQVGRSIAIQKESLNRLQRIFWSTFLPIVLLSFAAGAWMTTRTLQPIRQLTSSVQAILRTGQLSVWQIIAASLVVGQLAAPPEPAPATESGWSAPSAAPTAGTSWRGPPTTSPSWR